MGLAHAHPSAWCSIPGINQKLSMWQLKVAQWGGPPGAAEMPQQSCCPLLSHLKTRSSQLRVLGTFQFAPETALERKQPGKPVYSLAPGPIWSPNMSTTLQHLASDAWQVSALCPAEASWLGSTVSSTMGLGGRALSCVGGEEV